jgi:tetratricopeptide (TPR) repeat protein
MSKKPLPNKPKAVVIPTDVNALKKLKISLGMIIGVFAFILYAQSITFDYVNDDNTVITKNTITQLGISGIPTILKTSRLSGYKNGSMITPEYRPAFLIMFAIEWQISPNNPQLSHFINVLLYSLTCWLLFILLCKLFDKSSTDVTFSLIIPFVCTLLYVAHPIHTEVVCNIKSRDEILCFLFGICSILFMIKYYADNTLRSLIIGSFFYFLSLLSKETGLSFLILIPLTLFVFRETNFKKLIIVFSTLIIFTLIYFMIRYKALLNIDANDEISKMNQTFGMVPNFISREATAFYILFRYLILLVFPHPLVYEYSYNQIPIKTFKDAGALIGFIVYFAIGIYAILKIKNKSQIAFAILFYLLSLVAVSNVLIIIGSAMNERFLYIPSLGFCLLITLLLNKIIKTKPASLGNKNKYTTLNQLIKGHSKLFLIVFILVGIYSVKTFSRSQDWKSNITLFGHDVEYADNCARAHSYWGTAIIQQLYPMEKNPQLQKKYLDMAEIEYKKTIAISPTYYDAYLNLSSIYINTKQYDKALSLIDSVIQYYPNNASAHFNRGFALAQLGNNKEAVTAYTIAVKIDPTYPEASKNLGACLVNIGQFSNAINYLNKALELNPNDAECLYFMSVAYKNSGDTINSKIYLEKANRMRAGQKR